MTALMTRLPLRIMCAVAALAAVATVTGCGSSNKSSANAPLSTQSPTPTPSGTAPADPAAAEAQIKTNWQTFFAYATPLAKSESLLENGTSLAGAISFAKKEQQQTHIRQAAKVTAVAFTGPAQATVTYQLLNGTNVLLPGASGVAVLQDGTWKVSKQTFCTLVQLGANGKTVPGC